MHHFNGKNYALVGPFYAFDTKFARIYYIWRVSLKIVGVFME